MDLLDTLTQDEERFWKGDAAHYARHLTAGAVMVFPEPVGALQRQQIVASIGAGSRWQSVVLSDRRVVQPTPDTALLTYRAAARRDGDTDDYRALASSLYVQENGEWKLAFHQQTV